MFVFHEERCEMMMVGEFMADDMSKAAFSARVLPATLKKFDAEYFAMVNHHWTIEIEDVAVKDQFDAWCRDNPGRPWNENPVVPPGESLGIVFGSKDGTVVFKTSALERTEDSPPSLAGWEEDRADWHGHTEGMIHGRIIDFAMEALTGRRLVTEKTITQAAHAIAANSEVRAMLAEAWAAMGMTPEEGMEKFSAEGGSAYEQVNAKLLELFPDFGDKIKALTEEHLTDASDEYVEKAGVPDGMVVMISDDGTIEPLASFLADEKFQELLADEDEDE